jgi:hypothetical protein
MMNQKKEKIAYNGALKKSIAIPFLFAEASAVGDQKSATDLRRSFIDACSSHCASERVRKLPLLMRHYGIEDETDFCSLALALAIDHVPGFACNYVEMKLAHGDHGAVVPIKVSGRPKVWTSERLSNLLEAVEDVKANGRSKQDREVLRELARKREWAPLASHRGTKAAWIETLETRLQEAKSMRREMKLVGREAKKLLKILSSFEDDTLNRNSGN